MNWLRIIAIAIPLALNQARADTRVEFDVNWDCDQTYQTDVPVEAKLRFSYDFSKNEPDFPDYPELIKKADLHAGIDYFGCLSKALDDARDSIWQHCSGLRRKVSRGETVVLPPVCNRWPDILKSFKKYDHELLKYGQKAYTRGAVPPFAPAGKSRGGLNFWHKILMNDAVRKHCQLSSVGWFEFLDEEYLTKELPHAFKNTKCDRNSLSSQYLEILLDSQLSEKQCKEHPEACKERRGRIRKALSLLSVAGFKDVWEESLQVDEESGRQEDCVNCPVDESFERAMFQLAKFGSSATKCVKLTKEAPVKAVSGNMGSGLTSRYTLSLEDERESDRDYTTPDGQIIPKGTPVPVYRTTLNLKFEKAKDNELDYAKRAGECFAQAASLLRGPKGEYLELMLHEDEEADPVPPEIKISIPSEKVRSSSSNWSPEINCPTLVHEVMHLLGLVDEYKEDKKGAVYDAETNELKFVDDSPTHAEDNCRVLGPESSLMGMHGKAYDEMTTKFEVRFCTCGYALESRFCRNYIKKMKPGADKCFPGTTEFVAMWPPHRVEEEQLEAGKHFGGAFTLGLKEIKPIRQSLLHPAHFRAITQPGCEAENRVYYSCAKEAYRTSRGHFGKDKCSVGLPEECSDPAAWLK